MATISKFYLLDAASPDSGTLPTGAYAIHPHVGAGTDATGNATARDATDVAGASNPDIDATATAAANTSGQVLCLRRYVSRPLAARTFASGDGNWTFSYASGQSNINHNQQILCDVYAWSTSAGARVGSGFQSVNFTGNPSGNVAETADSVTAVWFTSTTISDGDILVVEVVDSFTQSMANAFTSFFSYDGTTEASTTTCASFITPPVPLTLFSSASLDSFNPASGFRGALPINIVGSGFTNTTAVAFNGIPALYSVYTDLLITAIVPALATTGPITVTTSDHGVLTSASNFTVLSRPPSHAFA